MAALIDKKLKNLDPAPRANAEAGITDSVVQCGVRISDPKAAQSSETMKPAILVPGHHGLDEASRRIVIEVLGAALLPVIKTVEIARAFERDDDLIYIRAARRFYEIVAGKEKLPSGAMAPLERVKCGRGVNVSFRQKPLFAQTQRPSPSRSCSPEFAVGPPSISFAAG